VPAECLKGVVGVLGHGRLAGDCGQERGVSPDHKRGPLGWQRADALHTKLLRDFAALVAEQRIAKTVLVVEFLLPIHRIGADSHSLCTEFCELGFQVTKMTALLRSTSGHCLRVKEQNKWPLCEQRTQRDRLSVLVRRRELRNLVSHIHPLTSRGRTRFNLALRNVIQREEPRS